MLRTQPERDIAIQHAGHVVGHQNICVRNTINDTGDTIIVRALGLECVGDTCGLCDIGGRIPPLGEIRDGG
jgi:hypothetical protein